MFLENKDRTKAVHYSLAGILLTGLLLRVWGLTAGLPDLYQTDEATIVTRSLETAKNYLDPGWVGYPSLWFYILDILYGMYYLVGTLLGQFISIETFALQYFKDPTYFYLLPRILSVLVGIAIPFLVYLIGTKFFNRSIGYITAILVTFNVAMVEHSHYATLDIPATFFVTLSLYLILKVYDIPSRRNYIVAGLVIGLGMSVKYLPVIAFSSLMVCHGFLYTDKKTNNTWLLFAGLCVIIGFLVGTPFFFKNAYSLFSYAKYQQVDFNYLKTLLINFSALIATINWLTIVLILFSIIYSVATCRKKNLIIATLILSYFFSISLFSKSYYVRWHLPYLPALYLLLVITTFQLYNKYSLQYKKLCLSILSILFVLLLVPQIIRTISFNYHLKLPDTRLLAKDWVESNIPDGSKIFLDSGRYLSNFSVPIKGPTVNLGENIYRKSAQLDGMESNIRKPSTIDYYNELLIKTNYTPLYQILRSRLAYPLVLDGTINIEWLKSKGIKYAILSSYYFGKYLNPVNLQSSNYNENGKKIKIFYKNLFNNSTLLKSYSPNKTTQGPYIHVLHLNTNLDLEKAENF